MKIISKLSLRYLKNNKRKFYVIIFSIILSTTLLTAISLGASTIRGNNVESAINSSGSHHAIFKNLDYSIYKNLKNDKDIKDIIIIQNINKINSQEIDPNNNDNFILTIKSFNENFSDYITLKKGTYPKDNQEIIISDELAYNLNLDVGTEINNLKVVGIYNENKLYIEEYSTNPITIKREFNPVAITKDEIKENLSSSYIVTFKNNIMLYNQIYKKADELKLNYTTNEYGTRIYDKMEENGRLLQSLGQYSNIKYQIGSYSYIMLILLVVSMFCIMTIKNSFSISLSERKKYFGSLRSLGASKKQIFNMVIFETLLVSIISIPIGILLGYGFTNLIIYIVNNMMKNFITSNYQLMIYPIYIIISFMFIIVTIIFSSITPAKKASETSPMEVLKETNSYSVQKSKENYPRIKKIFGIEGELAYKTLKRNNSKFSVTANSLIISILLFITLSGFTNFLFKNIIYTPNEDYGIIIDINDLKGKDEVLNKIKNIEEIDEIKIEKSLYLNYKKDDTILTEIAKKEEKDNYYPSIKILGIHEEDYNKLKKEIGLNEDKIILYNLGSYFDNNETKTTTWFNNDLKEIKICSIDNNILRGCHYTFNDIYLLNDNIIDSDHYNPTIIMSIPKMNNFISEYINKYETGWKITDSKKVYIKINTKNYLKVDEKLQDIFNEYSTLNLEDSYTNYTLQNQKEYTNVSVIKFIINSSMIFIVIISITGIINTMSTNLSLRETEFSVLRSIGLSKKGLNKMLFLESLFLGLKAIIYGISSGTFFVFLEMYFAYLMSQTSFPFPYNSCIISVLATFIIVFIMTIYSTSKLKNKNIIDSIRKQSI